MNTIENVTDSKEDSISMIVDGDKIVFMNTSEVEAFGPHATLLEISSTYRRLYNSRFLQGARNALALARTIG